MNKFFFGLFTFTLGLALGLFFHDFLWEIAPQTSSAVKGGVVVLSVVVFYFIWRLIEKFSNKEDE